MAPQKITATFEAVTPLFLGGADPASTVELRPPSIKGALRFWWRALAWGRHRGDPQALRKIHAEEASLFGAAGAESADDARGSAGQANFLLRVLAPMWPETVSKLKAGQVITGPGMRYFGYGLNEQGRERLCVPAPFRFSIELVIRRALDRPVVDGLVGALKVMGLLGGLGSRVRRGYGSLSLVSLAGDNVDAWEPPATSADYIRQVRTVIGSHALKAEQPPYTAFSARSRIVIVASDDANPLGLLDYIGKQMLRYRSWGRGREVLGQPSEENFKDDHDWFKDGASPARHPRRVVFGVPHNYSKYVGIDGPTLERHRRGSPLFVHVHKLQDGYIGVISILGAAFLRDGDKLMIRDGRHSTPCAPDIDWKVLDGFIDGVSKNSRKPYFPNRRQILP